MNKLFKESIEGALVSAEKITDPLEQTKMYIEIAKLTKDVVMDNEEKTKVSDIVTGQVNEEEYKDTLEAELFRNIDKIRQPILLEFIWNNFFKGGFEMEGFERIAELYYERRDYNEDKANKIKKECIDIFDNRTQDIKGKIDNGIDDKGLVEEMIDIINTVREKQFEIEILEYSYKEPTLRKIGDYTINLKKKPGIRGNEFCIKDIRTRGINELREFIEEGIDWKINRMKYEVESYEEELKER